MNFIKIKSILSIALYASIVSCTSTEKKENEPVEVKEETKIISLNGSVTEVLFAANLGDNIVGVDVTSTYPSEVHKLPKLGHVRKLNTEAMIGLQPNFVFVKEGEVTPEIQGQLKSAGAQIVSLNQDYSIEGTKSFIKEILEVVKAEDQYQTISDKIDKDLEQLDSLPYKPKVLFIYARGAGMMMVAGQNTQMDAIIKIAGGINAAQGFDDFKPLTPEAVITAAPDAILMFNSGKESLQESGIWQIPGLMETPAGKNKKIITMDAQFLSGFGPRVGEAAVELNKALKTIEK